jgi:hypothetical protein
MINPHHSHIMYVTTKYVVHVLPSAIDNSSADHQIQYIFETQNFITKFTKACHSPPSFTESQNI